MSSCPHVRSAVGHVEQFIEEEDITSLPCTPCGLPRQALWLCLYPQCRAVGCGKSAKDHSTAHFTSDESHCVHLSLSTWRVWCHACECEVFALRNDPPFPIPLPSKPSKSPPSPTGSSLSNTFPSSVAKKQRRESDSDADGDGDRGSFSSWDSGISSQKSLKIPLWPVGGIVDKKDYMSYEFFETEDWSDDDGGDVEDGSPLLFPTIMHSRKRPLRRGLVGFGNLGNTCYLNAALQTLCHVQPLVDFFLHCDETVAMAAEEKVGGCHSLPPVRPTRSDHSAHSIFSHSNVGAGGDDRLGPMEPRLVAAFTRLLQVMYENPSMPHLAPSAVLQGIRMVNPTFRGYYQQDSQEFMRCFMDQIHEETKYLVMRDPRDFLDLPEAGDGLDVGPSCEEVRDGMAGVENGYEDMEETTSGLQLSEGDSNHVSHVDQDGDVVMKSIPNGTDHVELAVETEDERGYETCDSGLSNSTSSDDSVEPDRRSLSSLPVTFAPSPSGLKKKQRYPSLHLPSVGLTDEPRLAHRSRSSDFVSADSNARRDASRASARSRTRSMASSRRHASAASQDRESRPSISKSYTSIISNVFDGKLMSSVQCLTCGQVSSTLETFQDLSLPIPSGESLQRLRSAGPSPTSALAASTTVSPPGPSSASKLTAGMGPLPLSPLVAPCTENASFHHLPGAVAAVAASLSSCSQDLPAPGFLSWLWNYFKAWIWGPTVSLHDCLAAFFSADELKGDNMYSCDTCKKLRNGMKVSRVLELPEVMCIHLKRFRHEYLGSSKVSTRVSFPLERLDMRPYLHKECKSEVTTYNLVGVICHLGNSLGGGHYISYCVSPGKRWYEFDDRTVTKVTADVVGNVEAYVLLYQKHDPMAWLKRERVVQLLNQSLREMDLMRFYVSKEWLVKFNTCAEPGPIDNSNFLCPHGGVWPHRAAIVNDLCVELPQSVWEELQKNFGGGSPCNRLQICRTCEDWQARVRKRQETELAKYQQLYDEFRETETSIYAIPLSWFRQWEAFVRGRMFDIPGTIDNKHVAKSVGCRQNGPLRTRYRNDYVQISEEMWEWFHDVYGGGPAVLLREAPPRKPVTSNGSDVEMSC